MTHLQALQISMDEISSAGGFWQKKNVVKVFELKPF